LHIIQLPLQLLNGVQLRGGNVEVADRVHKVIVEQLFGNVSIAATSYRKKLRVQKVPKSVRGDVLTVRVSDVLLAMLQKLNLVAFYDAVSWQLPELLHVFNRVSVGMGTPGMVIDRVLAFNKAGDPADEAVRQACRFSTSFLGFCWFPV
jgi:hypothetical protein